MGDPPAGPHETTLWVAGTGSFASEIVELARRAGAVVGGLLELVDPARQCRLIHGLPVRAVGAPPPGARAILGVGSDRARHAQTLVDAGWQSRSLVHPRAELASSVRLAPGAAILAGAVVGAHSEVGAHALLSRGVLVGHHSRIGQGAVLNPGANVAGHVQIGAHSRVGMGAIISNGLRIGTGAVVAAGALVLADVPDGRRVQGVPAVEYRK